MEQSGELTEGICGMLDIEWKTDSPHRNVGKNTNLVLDATSLEDPVTGRKEEQDRGIPARY